MITSAAIAWNFDRNAVYMRTHLEALTHTDSLVQPPIEGNCINWILGHVVCYRNYILAVLGLPPILPAETLARYARGSAPVLVDGPDVVELDDLVRAYWKAQDAILQALPDLSPDRAAEVAQAAGFEMPRAELLVSFMRHESYHAGQLEWLRVWAIQQRP
jgi:hypothetical protein